MPRENDGTAGEHDAQAEEATSISKHHVGARPLPLPSGVVSEASLHGPENCYRYRLEWRLEQPTAATRTVMWLMMNPSVADHECGDRTVLKCWGYGLRWGYNRMLVGNSMAYRVAKPARLAGVEDPVGPDNMSHLLQMALQADLVIMAYGKPKTSNRIARVAGRRAHMELARLGIEFHALRLCADGTPRHPRPLPNDLRPFKLTS